MKILLLIIALKFNLLVNNGTFCDGFKAGYTYGWTNGKSVGCTPPIPVCVVTHIYCQTYECGFVQGYKQAIRDKK